MTVIATRRVGRTSAALTELGLGGANLGNLHRALADDQAQTIVDAAWDNGIRYFDTAPHYGVGQSERRLGAALTRRPRDEYVLSTKVGRLLVPNESPTGSDLANGFQAPDDLRRAPDYSRAGVRRSLEDSLERMGLDRIDIALLHDPEDHIEQALDEALPELARMRDEGIVRAIGVGMNQWQAPLRFVSEADLDVVMLAGRWTLLDRSGEKLLEACREREVSVVAAAPFNSGLLAQPRPGDQSLFNYAAPPRALLAAARALADVADAHGVVLPQAALQFPLRHPAVASVVTGLDSTDHVRSNARWLADSVPEAFWAEADRIVEGLL
jgi:D-threo-aldose 1-dehydrogenase